MVPKNRKERAGKKKVKVLNLDKETVKDLTGEQTKRVKGGIVGLSLVGGSVPQSGAGPLQRSKLPVRATSTLNVTQTATC